MSALALLTYLAPLLLGLAAFGAYRATGLRPVGARRATHGATLAAGSLAALALFTVLLNGAVSSPLVGAAGLGLQVRLDALSVTLLTLVSFVGWVVVRYARNYMDGDDRQGPFLGGLCLTLAAVMLLVTAGNLLQLFLGWVLTGAALNRLLVFYADRPAARLAARKKALFGRIGDLALLGALATLYVGFGTGDIAAITAALREGAPPSGLGLAAALLALAALVKSAQVPAHGWLTEVMETPTPVSALLHAGVINAGGFLVIRFADVMLASLPAMHLLALVGGATAAIASLVMLTQTSVKLSLAWSTIAQMGFMLLQVGFGAFTAALLHIVAHSLYKAHAFLGAGSVVAAAQAKVKSTAAPRLRDAALALGLAAVAVTATGWAFGVTLATKPAFVVFGAVLVMGLAHLILLSGATSRGALVGRTLGVTVGVSTLYFLLQLGTEALVSPTVPASAAVGPVTQGLMVLAVAVFAAVALIQTTALQAPKGPRWQALQVHLRNGLYMNTLVNRLIHQPAR